MAYLNTELLLGRRKLSSVRSRLSMSQLSIVDCVKKKQSDVFGYAFLYFLSTFNLTIFSQLLFFPSKIDFASVSKKWKESPISLWDNSFADF